MNYILDIFFVFHCHIDFCMHHVASVTVNIPYVLPIAVNIRYLTSGMASYEGTLMQQMLDLRYVSVCENPFQLVTHCLFSSIILYS